jgi:hypothetical protein
MVPMLAILVPIAARAEPAPVEVAEIELDCESPQLCAAMEFANALASQPAGSQVQPFGSIFAFEPGRVRVYSKDREKLMALAAYWREHIEWATITVEGDTGPSSDVALAQRRADKIGDYLIRYGVPAEYVVAVAHEHIRDDAQRVRVAGGHVDLLVTRCDRTSDECRPGAIHASNAAGSTVK